MRHMIIIAACCAVFLTFGQAKAPAQAAQKTPASTVQARQAATFKDVESARKAAAQGNSEALAWLQKAAQQRNAEAQFSLGVMYAEGRGVPKDYRKAVEWLNKAADQRLAEAQFMLGLMYGGGLGVAKNEAKAMEWIKKAAAQGFAPAKKALADANAKQTPAQSYTQLPSKKTGSNPLIGTWSSGPETPIKDSERWIEFRSDGTFTWQFPDYLTYRVGPYELPQGYFTWSGKYSVSEDRIIVTNIHQKFTTNMTNDQARVNRLTGPVKNDEWKFYFSNEPGFGPWQGLTWLYIYFFPNDPSLSYDYFVKPTLVK